MSDNFHGNNTEFMLLNYNVSQDTHQRTENNRTNVTWHT